MDLPYIKHTSASLSFLSRVAFHCFGVEFRGLLHTTCSMTEVYPTAGWPEGKCKNVNRHSVKLRRFPGGRK